MLGILAIDDNTGRLECPGERELMDMMNSLDSKDMSDVDCPETAWTDQEIEVLASMSDDEENGLIEAGESMSDDGYRTFDR